MKKIKEKFYEFRLLLKNIPSVVTVIFVVAVLLMNLFANKSIDINVDWLALDCGIFVSWIVFLCMDVLTKHFGPKAATQMSFFAIFLNLFVSLLLFLISKVPGNWGQFYQLGENDLTNIALNGTFASSWYVVFGSAVALAFSSILNNSINFAIGKALKKDCFFTFILRAYVSTAISQFADNFIFAFIVSHFFFDWTILQCITCAVTGMIAELVFEAIFSPLGFYICKKWVSANVGKEYFNLRGRL